jgi:TRAP-type transport system periplasmic protein
LNQKNVTTAKAPRLFRKEEAGLRLMGWLCCLLAATLIVLSSPARAAEPARAHIGFGPDHPLAQSGWRAFGERLDKTKGAPKLSLFLNGPPPSDPAAIESLGRNDYAFGAAALSAFPTVFPYAALLAELGLAGGEDELAAAAAVTELLALDCVACRQSFFRRRVVFLGAYGAARYVMLSQEQANTVVAFRSLSALTPGSAWDRLIQRLGGRAHEEDGDPGDLLAKGAITAAIATPMELSDPDVWRHARYALKAPFGAYRGGAAFMGSAAYWQSLTPNERRAVLTATADGIVGVVWGYQNMAAAALRAAAARGLQVDVATPQLDEAIRAAIAADNKLVAETAGERFAVRDAALFLDRFLLLYDKFAVLLSTARDAPSAAAVLKREIFDRIPVETYGLTKG